MSETQNKIEFGLSNVHFAMMTTNTLESATYEKPIPIPGAVELSLSANGEIMEFEADNGIYFATQNNNGYEGSVTFALLPDEFRIKALGDTMDSANKVLVENILGQSKPFALMFEFEGDKNKTKHVLYNCVANRPNVTGKTKGNGEPSTAELNFRSMGRAKDGKVKAKTTGDTPASVVQNWYKQVFEITSGGD